MGPITSGSERTAAPPLARHTNDRRRIEAAERRDEGQRQHFQIHPHDPTSPAPCPSFDARAQVVGRLGLRVLDGQTPAPSE
jgi:hypothetical protein